MSVAFSSYTDLFSYTVKVEYVSNFVHLKTGVLDHFCVQDFLARLAGFLVSETLPERLRNLEHRNDPKPPVFIYQKPCQKG